MFENYDHLGARSYYCEAGRSTTCEKKISDLLKNISNRKLHIDPVGTLGVIMKNYPIANRTLISGIERTPWMAKPDRNGGWAYANIPAHKNIDLAPIIVAQQLKEKMSQEALEFVSGKNTIGILLSGGMDSRIVAGVLRNLQIDQKFTGQVVALSWGVKDCRDVIYAQNIARRFKWDFVHLPLTPELLIENINFTAELGAEFSPLHLHAMQLVAKQKNIDGILAGSYGDSIGRGEYSGKRIDQLPNILSSHMNHFSLLTKKVEASSIAQLKLDLIHSRAQFPGRSEKSYREIERQMHYMRRQLNTCMGVIDDKIPLYQMFTSPEVFGYMWQLSAKSRNDEIYKFMLKDLPGSLLDIPWARTGKIYCSNTPEPIDNHLKSNNLYGSWLRNECREYVINTLKDGHIQSLNIFNERAIDHWISSWGGAMYSQADRLDEKMAWLASLAIFIKTYNVQPFNLKSNYSIQDSLSEKKSIIHTWLYQKLRKSFKK